jgi:ABC-type branched-subunit amino acid transport system substrate-binding protein
LPPLPYVDTTYDAVVLIALAAEKAGTTTDSAAIRDALRDIANPPGEVVGPGVDGLERAMELIADGKDINYEGAAGSQDIDENGDVFSTIEVWKIEGGAIISMGYEQP